MPLLTSLSHQTLGEEGQRLVEAPNLIDDLIHQLVSLADQREAFCVDCKD